jgi:hypothetical protein
MNLTKRSKLCIGSGAQGFRKKSKSSPVKRHYHLKQAHMLLAVQKCIIEYTGYLWLERRSAGTAEIGQRDAKGNVLHGGHMILAPSFGHGVLRSYTHNGPFFFLGSSGGMSYLVSTSSSIEFHPFDPKGMAGFNT